MAESIRTGILALEEGAKLLRDETANLLQAIDELEEGSGGTSPVPVPVNVAEAVVTPPLLKTVINARCIQNYNQAGYPRLSIYPRSGAPIPERVQFKTGAKVRVFVPAIRADGGGRYFRLAKRITYSDGGSEFVEWKEGDKVLFVRKEDVDIL